MNRIAVLDCTLRDGGYINNWNFGHKQIKSIVQALSCAKVEFIEVGFLSKENQFSDVNSSVYSEFSSLEIFDTVRLDNSKLVGMISFGKFPLGEIPPADQSRIKILRIIFKKGQQDDALDYCKNLVSKGYKVFVNPTHTYDYSDQELLNLISKVNEINPFGFSIVDTLGVLQESKLLHLYSVIDYNLNKNIALGFHSHNNLQLSFSNSVAIVNFKSTRKVIIDSSLSGMGRGAGNLCTELILKHLNENEGYEYCLSPIYEILDNCIKPIFDKKNWGYNLPYFLAASNYCHPNYALYLSNLGTVSYWMIDKIMKLIPLEKSRNFDESYISDLYYTIQSKNKISDENEIRQFSCEIDNHKILLIGPGPSILLEHEKIRDFINTNKPTSISVNFFTDAIQTDYVFVSNEKRFGQLSFSKLNKLLITSNLEEHLIKQQKLNISNHKTQPRFTFNYSSHLNPVTKKDNAAIMLIDILVSAGIKELFMAGFDGFDQTQNNFFSADLNIVTNNSEKLTNFNNEAKNKEWSDNIVFYRNKGIKITYITSTLYTE